MNKSSLITLNEAENNLFKTVIQIINDEHKTFNGTIIGIEVDDNSMITCLVTSKDLLTNQNIIAVPYKKKEEDEIEYLTIQTELSNWKTYENGLAFLPFSGVINLLKKEDKTFINTIITTKWLPSESIPTSLFERTITITYLNGVMNSDNFYPLSYIADTASPISHNFDGKPYFILNGKAPDGIIGSPVFIDQHVLLEGQFAFVGIWIAIKNEEKIIGKNNLSIVLKAEEIIKTITEIKDEIAKNKQ